MSDTEAPVAPTELDLLKDRAKRMGITHSNNISVEALRKKIEDKLNDEEPEADASDALENGQDDGEVEEVTSRPAPVSRKAREAQIRQDLIAEQMKLVRLRITNLDPKKKDLPGEVLTIANEYLGTVRKYVPFGEQTENGYHVPYCIYQMMKDRRFLNIRTTKVNGQTKVSSNWAPEFALEVLPQLTEAELTRLANQQAASGSIDNGLE